MAVMQTKGTQQATATIARKLANAGLVAVLSVALAVLACGVPASFVFEDAGTAYAATTYTVSTVPAYDDDAYVDINGGDPEFTKSEITTTAYESYSSLDSLGRCGEAEACIGTELMPGDDETRGSISSVYPTGWVQAKYSIISGGYLYNRCHLIGWQLTGQNANKKNLITGTRYLNVTGMLPFENDVADYIEDTDNHVMYRVTPYFSGSNLLASGVQMEAYSVEDSGKGISFNVYCYNVQPGITINYATGKSSLAGTTISTCKVKLSKTTYTYNGRKRKPKVTVRTSSGKKLKKGKHYTVTYKKNKAIGTAKVVVKGKGSYSGKKTKTFTIKPAKGKVTSVKTSGSKGLKVRAKKVEGNVAGYQVAYRVKGTSGWKKTKGTSTTIKLTKLRAGRTYQVKVRAYGKVSGRRVYGAWSKVKTGKTAAASTASSSSSSSSSSSGGKTVYVTATGTKYHVKGCRYLASSSVKMKKSKAIAAGYEPCKVCIG